jgi:hypothetical protein
MRGESMAHVSQSSEPIALVCIIFVGMQWEKPHTICNSDFAQVSTTPSSSKEAKFQPYTPLSHISLDAFPLVQVSCRTSYQGLASNCMRVVHSF